MGVWKGTREKKKKKNLVSPLALRQRRFQLWGSSPVPKEGIEWLGDQIPKYPEKKSTNKKDIRKTIDNRFKKKEKARLEQIVSYVRRNEMILLNSSRRLAAFVR